MFIHDGNVKWSYFYKLNYLYLKIVDIIILKYNYPCQCGYYYKVVEIMLKFQLVTSSLNLFLLTSFFSYYQTDINSLSGKSLIRFFE